MSLKAARLIFWLGTLVSLSLFVALTVDTQRQFGALTHAEKIDAAVIAGKKAFERYNCNDCHTILGFGGYYAPDLTRTYGRLGEDSIRRRLKHPEQAFADSFRKMPNQNLSDAEVENLVAYFRWVAAIENNDWPPQHSEARWKRSTQRLLAGATLSPGAALIRQESCLECHALGEMGKSKGQRLEWIARERDAAWIADYLNNPAAVAPGAEMPAYDHLTPEQRLQIGEFIASLRTMKEEK